MYTRHSWECNGEQSHAVEDCEVALNDPRWVAQAYPTNALSD